MSAFLNCQMDAIFFSVIINTIIIIIVIIIVRLGPQIHQDVFVERELVWGIRVLSPRSLVNHNQKP